MQMVKKGLLVFLIVWIGAVVFMPKRELYYLAEHYLEQQDIRIASEKIDEGWFSLTIENPVIYVQGIKVATVEKISIFTLLAYSSAEAEGITPDASLASFIPGKIDESHLSHTLFSPQKIKLWASGGFGEAQGNILLSERRLEVHFSDTGKLGMLRSKLTKDDEGWKYETAF